MFWTLVIVQSHRRAGKVDEGALIDSIAKFQFARPSEPEFEEVGRFLVLPIREMKLAWLSFFKNEKYMLTNDK